MPLPMCMVCTDVATGNVHFSSRHRVPFLSTDSAAVHAACVDRAQLPCFEYVHVGAAVHALPSLSASKAVSHTLCVPPGVAVHVAVPGVKTQWSVLSGHCVARSAGWPQVTYPGSLAIQPRLKPFAGRLIVIVVRVAVACCNVVEF